MAENSACLLGHLDVVVRDRDGNLKAVRSTPNTIVNDGLAQGANLLVNAGGTAFNNIALGTGTASPTSTDTTLSNETHRNNATASVQTTSVTDDTSQLQNTFVFGSAYSITESGIFNDPSSGQMGARQTFDAVSVQDTDTLEVTWKIQFAEGS